MTTQAPRRKSGPVARALLAALAGHALLLGVLITSSNQPRTSTSGAPPALMLVRLPATPAPAEFIPAPREPPTDRKRPARTPAARPTLAAKGATSPPAARESGPGPSAQAADAIATAALAAKSVPSAATTPPDPSPDGSTQPGAGSAPTADALNAARNDIQIRIHRDFSRHFSYPPLARRHGWEGAVRLGYDVTPEGRVINVRVLASSGYLVLDRDAQETLSRIPPLGPTGWPRPIEALELAVHYQLMEG
jgi:TonB family protein